MGVEVRSKANRNVARCHLTAFLTTRMYLTKPMDEYGGRQISLNEGR